MFNTSENAALDTLQPGWIDTPKTRGTFDIVWSCFFTIFVCTFTVLHLNLPAPNDETPRILLRRIKWMAFAIIIPELVTASAFAQRTAARNSVERMSKAHKFNMSRAGPLHGKVVPQWTMRHAFYWNMGGVRIKTLDEKNGFPINAELQCRLEEAGVLLRPSLTGREIWDKSKADKFAKFLACMQIGWLIVQSVARVAQGLPVSLLEVATIGFVLPSFATFFLWWHKPNSIETPTVLTLNQTTTEILAELGQPSSAETDWLDTPLDSITPINKPSATSEIILKSSFWPGRKRFGQPADRIRNDVFALKYTILDQVMVASVWMGYGAVHFTAWNFVFPSRTEKYLWRISTSVMMGSLVLTWIVGNRKFYLLFSCISANMRRTCQRVSDERQRISTIQVLMGAFAGLLYLCARMCIIVQVLVALRAMPAGVFQSIEWTHFVPHV